MPLHCFCLLQKKGKKGKGQGKKGKTSHEANDNKLEEDDNENEGEKEDSGEEGDGLDHMNVSDLDGSDNEQQHNVDEGVGLSGNNNETELAVDCSGAPEVISNSDAQLQSVPESNSQHSQASEKDCDTNTLDSNKVKYLADDNVNCASSERMESVKDAIKDSEENHEVENEGASRQTQNSDSLQRGISEKPDSVSFDGNDNECPQKMLDVDNKISSMDISNRDQEIVSTLLNHSESLQSNADEMAEQDSSALHCVERGDQLSLPKSRDCKVESDVEKASGGTQSVLSVVNEFVEEIVNLALNASLENGDKFHEDPQVENASRSTSTCAENPSEDNAVREDGKSSLENGSGTFAATEGLPSGNFETVSVSRSEKNALTSSGTNSSPNETDSGTFERKSNKMSTGRVENDQDCAATEQRTNTSKKEEPCSDSAKGEETQEALELGFKNGEHSGECETDSEEENENDCRTLTLQPAYHPSPGECSVMSCLSQFCTAELLDGSNKFACEECSKRAQRVKKGKGSKTAKDDDKDDVSSDSSSEGQLKCCLPMNSTEEF